MQSRRRVLERTAAVGLPLWVAGCVGSRPDGEQSPTDPPTDDVDVDDPEPVGEAVFDSWEPDTTCNGGEQESMHNSEISVQAVLGERPSSTNPVAYDALPEGEKEILAEVLTVGGYATCETSAAFDSFLERAVYGHADEQAADDTSVYLAYDGNYYKLYLRKQDQVYAY